MKTQTKVFTAEKIIKAQKTKMIIAFSINLAVALLCALGLIWSYAINRYIHVTDQKEKIWFWGWFTFLSTAFIGGSCILSIAFMVRAFMRGNYQLPNFTYVIKTAAISATIVTFAITQYDLWKDLPKIHWNKITEANLVEHILIPFLSVPCYFILERTTKMKFVHNCYSMILGGLYSGHYLAVGYTHWDYKTGKMPSGPVGDLDRYDRYGIFKMFGPKYAWVLIFALCGALFLFAWLSWLINKKIHVGEGKEAKVITLKTVGIDRYYTVEKEKVVTKTVEVIKPVVKKEVIIKEVPVKAEPKPAAKKEKPVKVKDPNRLSKGAIAAMCAIPAGVFVITLLLVLLVK